jgi:hypothetical protein
LTLREIAPRAVDPPLNYLSYRPRGELYHVGTVWGYASMGERRVTCIFSIYDTLTGATYLKSKAYYRHNAELVANTWRDLCKKMNREARELRPS